MIICLTWGLDFKILVKKTEPLVLQFFPVFSGPNTGHYSKEDG